MHIKGVVSNKATLAATVSEIEKFLLVKCIGLCSGCLVVFQPITEVSVF